MRSLFKLLALFALPLVLVAPAPAQTRAAASSDWSRVVTALPNGAFLLGSPTAKSRLIEYFSYTCPHCADFAGAPTAELKAGWVRRGLLAIEYRNYVRDGFDMTAALLTRCAGAGKFLAAHEAVFAGFKGWMDQAQKYAQSQQGAPPQTDRAAQFVDIAAKTGLNATLVRVGVPATQQKACLTDKAALSTLLALTAGAWDVDPNFEGTPGFALNGKPLDHVHDWTRLKPLLPALPAPGK